MSQYEKLMTGYVFAMVKEKEKIFNLDKLIFFF